MIESWCKGINDFIKQRVGVLEQCGYDPSNDQYETYCETVVLFFMVGTPRAGYDFGIGMVNDFYYSGHTVPISTDLRLDKADAPLARST